jgi:hypothetical protein
MLRKTTVPRCFRTLDRAARKLWTAQLKSLKPLGIDNVESTAMQVENSLETRDGGSLKAPDWKMFPPSPKPLKRLAFAPIPVLTNQSCDSIRPYNNLDTSHTAAFTADIWRSLPVQPLERSKVSEGDADNNRFQTFLLQYCLPHSFRLPPRRTGVTSASANLACVPVAPAWEQGMSQARRPLLVDRDGS